MENNWWIMENHYFVRTKFKLALNIDTDGFDMSTDDWQVSIRCGSKETVCNKEQNSFCDEDGQWYLLVDSAVLGAGQYVMVTDIDVPDTDFPDGRRHETYKQVLFSVNAV